MEENNGRQDHWEFYPEGNKNLWRWRRISPNGRVVGASYDAYKNKKDCEANAIRNHFQKAGKPSYNAANRTSVGQEDQWLVHQEQDGLWYWRRLSPNGRIVGASHEGYKNKKDCEFNAMRHGFEKSRRSSI